METPPAALSIHDSEAVNREIWPMGPLLNIDQVAAYFGLRPKTIYGMVRDRRIPHTRIGNAVRFDPDTLTKWLEANSKPGRVPAEAS